MLEFKKNLFLLHSILTIFKRYIELHSIFIFSLSNWVKYILNNNNDVMEYFVAVSFYSYTYSPEMRKAKTGFLMRLIFQRFKNKSLSHSKPDFSLYTYCAHQGTLTNILNFLNVFKVTPNSPYHSISQ